MLAQKKIYLAGPITGCNYNSARFGWRQDFKNALDTVQAVKHTEHIQCYSPMREKEFLEKDQCIGAELNYESLHGFGTPQGILTRDHNDVKECDAMIACFLGATRVSIGTCIEIGFAHAYRKPLILVMEPAAFEDGLDGDKSIRGTVVKNVHDHVFLRACAGYCVPTLKHAADIAFSLLTPSL